MTIDLYYMPGSVPCTSVRLLARALGIELNLIYTNILKREQLTPEYIKLNPQHTIPTMVDDGFVLWESRAILEYLVEKYGAKSSLFPECVKIRAQVHQRLFFELATLWPRFGEYIYPQLFGGQPADPVKLEKVHDALDFLNAFLEGQTYAAGDELTIADYSLYVSMLSFVTAGIDLERHENVAKWFTACKEAINKSDVVEEFIATFQKLIDAAKK